jgi:hypothetical protein
MAVDAAKRGLPLASTSHRTKGTRTLVACGLPVALVLAAGVVWPAFGKFVTLLLKIAVLYVFSTR